MNRGPYDVILLFQFEYKDELFKFIIPWYYMYHTDHEKETEPSINQTLTLNLRGNKIDKDIYRETGKGRCSLQ